MAVVEQTIDIIGDDAFCAIILGRSIPGGMPVDIYDTDLRKLRNHALRNMSGLESVSFPNVTSVGSYAFAECPNLKRASLPLVTSLPERVFFSNSSLEELDLPKVTSIGQFCISGKALKRLELPSLTTTGNSGLILYSLPALEEVIVPRLATVGKTTFHTCTALKQMDLPSAVSLGSQFLSGCKALEVVNIGPNLKTIDSTAFQETPNGLVINLSIAEGEIAGAPWGAPNAIINYEVPYSGKVPMPES